MEVKKQLQVWYFSCGLVCLGCLSATFLWRSQAGMLVVCFSPCLGVICLVAMVVYLLKVKFHWKHAIFGFLLMGTSFALGATGDSVARELIYRWNLHGYRHTAAEILRNPPPQNGDLPSKLISGFGIHSASYKKEKGITTIEFYTNSGPSLETAVFSTQPLPTSERLYELKNKDDLGYWYFMNRS